jgi:hypothetical protein
MHLRAFGEADLENWHTCDRRADADCCAVASSGILGGILDGRRARRRTGIGRAGGLKLFPNTSQSNVNGWLPK